MMNKMKGIMAVALSALFICPAFLFAGETGAGVDEQFQVSSDGADLYLRVRGEDRTSPVLLFLHGGPGDATGPLLFQAYAGPELEKHFVVGYLHQRGTCMSAAAPVETLTVGQFVRDVDAVVSFLKEKFQKDQIFLLGHSFGGGLGYLYLLEHEKNVRKFVSAGGAFSTRALEQSGYQTVMELAQKVDDQEAVKRLTELGPPPYATIQQGMVWRMLGMTILQEMNEGMTRNLDMAKVVAVTGIEGIDPEWQQKSMIIVNAMWNELGSVDIEDQVKNISVPLLLITGARDIMVPPRILQKGFENYGGPKERFSLQKSNHMMFMDEPDLFATTVIDFFKK
jgi:pimeloyl-ACP methyl ester carboxylesterase